MFANPMEWIILFTLLIIITLLAIMLIQVNSAVKQLSTSETVVTATALHLNKVATDVDTLLTKVEPVITYAEGMVCKLVTPKPSFCP